MNVRSNSVLDIFELESSVSNNRNSDVRGRKTPTSFEERQEAFHNFLFLEYSNIRISSQVNNKTIKIIRFLLASECSEK